MTDSDKTPQDAPRRRRYKRIRQKDSWLRDRHDSTKDEMKQWNDAGMPAHLDIVAGFLASNDFVFGIPDRSEIFRLDAITRASSKMFGGDSADMWKNVLRLHYVQPSPVPTVHYTMAHPPIGVEMGDIVEVNYNVRLSALVREMNLVNVRVVHGSMTDNDSSLVFEAAEFPGPAIHRQIRMVRITALWDGFGRWETLAETTYPRGIV